MNDAYALNIIYLWGDNCWFFFNQTENVTDFRMGAPKKDRRNVVKQYIRQIGLDGKHEKLVLQ